MRNWDRRMNRMNKRHRCHFYTHNLSRSMPYFNNSRCLDYSWSRGKVEGWNWERGRVNSRYRCWSWKRYRVNSRYRCMMNSVYSWEWCRCCNWEGWMVSSRYRGMVNRSWERGRVNSRYRC